MNILQQEAVAVTELIACLVRHPDKVLPTIQFSLGMSAWDLFPDPDASLVKAIMENVVEHKGRFRRDALVKVITDKEIQRLRDILSKRQGVMPTLDDVKGWCCTISDGHLGRKSLLHAQEATKAILEGDDPKVVIQKHHDALSRLTVLEVRQDDARETQADAAVLRIDQLVSPDQDGIYIPTGIPALDRTIGGIPVVDEATTIITGVSGSGKTAFASGICFDHAAHMFETGQEGCIVYFLGETSGIFLRSRDASRKERINFRKVSKFKLLPPHERATQDEIARLKSRVKQTAQHPLQIVDVPGLTVSEMVMWCHRYRNQFGRVKLVVIDHIELFRPDAVTRSGEDNYVNAIYQQLRRAFKPFNCGLMVQHQMNREQLRTSKPFPPSNDMLRYGGEQDAWQILWPSRPFIFRDSMNESMRRHYGLHEIPEILPNDSPSEVHKKEERLETLQNMAEIYVTKVRDDEDYFVVGTEDVRYDRKYVHWQGISKQTEMMTLEDVLI